MGATLPFHMPNRLFPTLPTSLCGGDLKSSNFHRHWIAYSFCLFLWCSLDGLWKSLCAVLGTPICNQVEPNPLGAPQALLQGRMLMDVWCICYMCWIPCWCFWEYVLDVYWFSSQLFLTCVSYSIGLLLLQTSCVRIGGVRKVYNSECLKQKHLILLLGRCIYVLKLF